MIVNNCHPLANVCLLLNAVGRHLESGNFMSSTLDEHLLPKSERIVYKSSAADETREDALPIVAYTVGNLTLTPYQPHQHIGGDGSTAAELTGSIQYTVSTTNEALTSELAFEIAAYCMSLHKALQEHSMHIGSITVSSVQRGKANYFEATVNLQAHFGRPIWQHGNESDILREIGISLNIL